MAAGAVIWGFKMGMLKRLMAVLFVPLIAIPSGNAKGKELPDRSKADAGRELAIEACTGCHVVSDNQPFPPLLKGAPDFRKIANQPNVTATSLRRTIAALPQVPPEGHMANPLLTEKQLADVAAYIMTMQEHHANK
jgi:mono/diheme cytochrome c family protein